MIRITKKQQLLRIVNEQKQKEILDKKILDKAIDIIKKEFDGASFDGRDNFSSFQEVLEDVLKRKMTLKEKNDPEFKHLEKLCNNISDAADNIEYAYRVKGEIKGKKAEADFYSLLDELVQ